MSSVGDTNRAAMTRDGRIRYELFVDFDGGDSLLFIGDQRNMRRYAALLRRIVPVRAVRIEDGLILGEPESAETLPVGPQRWALPMT